MVVVCTIVVTPSPVTSLLLKSPAVVQVFVFVAADEKGRYEGRIYPITREKIRTRATAEPRPWCHFSFPWSFVVWALVIF